MMYFPDYRSHEEAKLAGCFNCHQDLSSEQEVLTDYPIGRFVLKCPKCGFSKYYDIVTTDSK